MAVSSVACPERMLFNACFYGFKIKAKESEHSYCILYQDALPLGAGFSHSSLISCCSVKVQLFLIGHKSFPSVVSFRKETKALSPGVRELGRTKTAFNGQKKSKK